MNEVHDWKVKAQERFQEVQEQVQEVHDSKIKVQEQVQEVHGSQIKVQEQVQEVHGSKMEVQGSRGRSGAVRPRRLPRHGVSRAWSRSGSTACATSRPWRCCLTWAGGATVVLSTAVQHGSATW